MYYMFDVCIHVTDTAQFTDLQSVSMVHTWKPLYGH